MELLLALVPSSLKGTVRLLEEERYEERGMAVHGQGMRLAERLRAGSLLSLSSLMSLTSLFVRAFRSHAPLAGDLLLSLGTASRPRS
jgi:hypothetical protein